MTNHTSGNDKGMGGKITRLEVIDHTSDGEGRAYHKWAKEPFSVTYDIQDDGRTVKVFLGNPEWGIDLLATDPDDDVEATSNVQPNLTLDKTIGKLFVNYRVKCDVALSERNDGFYTQEDYEKAIQWELDHATQSINHLITQARIDTAKGLKIEKVNTDRITTDHAAGYNMAVADMNQHIDDYIERLSE
jgi:signal transduction histidine kinase